MPPASRMQAGLAAGVTDESDSYSSSDETDSLSSPFRATFIANADDSRYSQQSNAPAQQSRTKTGSSNAPTSRLTRQFSAAESASIVSKSTKSVVAFNARDAITGHPLLDPVLGSDGLSKCVFWHLDGFTGSSTSGQYMIDGHCWIFMIVERDLSKCTPLLTLIDGTAAHGHKVSV